VSAPSAALPPTPDDPLVGELPTVVDGVAVVNWPTEAGIRAVRARDELPRVLLITGDDPPPLVWDDLEDWVRDSAAPEEVAARTARVARQARSRATERGSSAVVLDADGIVRTAEGRWASVPPVEARLLAPLLDRPGHVVHRADLQRAAWPAGNVNERALDGRIKLLRRRVAPLGLAIHTVRALGFLLEAAHGP
jgi:DNA-binding response OmpR family regulator